MVLPFGLSLGALFVPRVEGCGTGALEQLSSYDWSTRANHLRTQRCTCHAHPHIPPFLIGIAHHLPLAAGFNSTATNSTNTEGAGGAEAGEKQEQQGGADKKADAGDDKAKTKADDSKSKDSGKDSGKGEKDAGKGGKDSGSGKKDSGSKDGKGKDSSSGKEDSSKKGKKEADPKKGKVGAASVEVWGKDGCWMGCSFLAGEERRRV